MLVHFLPVLLIVAVIGAYEWWSWHQSQQRRKRLAAEDEEIRRLLWGRPDPVATSSIIWVDKYQPSPEPGTTPLVASDGDASSSR